MTREQIEKLQNLARTWFFEDIPQWKDCASKERKDFLEERLNDLAKVILDCQKELDSYLK